MKGKGKSLEIVPGVFVPEYDEYLTVHLNNPEIDIFKVYRDIVNCCGREPKISSEGKSKLVVQAKSLEESQRLQSLTSLGGVEVECAPHISFNYTKGIIYAPQLMKYSEERLKEELEHQGVIKVERLSKKVNGVVTYLPNLILTFKTTKLPEMIRAAWHKLKVRQFMPRPRPGSLLFRLFSF